MRFPALAHGAVTASIVGRLAPNTKIVVYPVFADEIDRPSELEVAWSLKEAVKRTRADVILMCLQLSKAQRDHRALIHG